MSVRTDRDQFSAKFAVPFQNAAARVWFTESVAEAAGVDFETFTILNEIPKNGIDEICIRFIRIIGILVRTIAHDVIHMAECVKGRDFFHGFQLGKKVFFVAFAFAFSLKKRRKIRIAVVDKVLGRNDEIKWILRQQLIQSPADPEPPTDVP